MHLGKAKCMKLKVYLPYSIRSDFATICRGRRPSIVASLATRLGSPNTGYTSLQCKRVGILIHLFAKHDVSAVTSATLCCLSWPFSVE